LLREASPAVRSAISANSARRAQTWPTEIEGENRWQHEKIDEEGTEQCGSDCLAEAKKSGDVDDTGGAGGAVPLIATSSE